MIAAHQQIYNRLSEREMNEHVAVVQPIPDLSLNNELVNLNELKQHCKEEWTKNPPQLESLIKSYRVQLLQVSVARGG